MSIKTTMLIAAALSIATNVADARNMSSPSAVIVTKGFGLKVGTTCGTESCNPLPVIIPSGCKSRVTCGPIITPPPYQIPPRNQPSPSCANYGNHRVCA